VKDSLTQAEGSMLPKKQSRGSIVRMVCGTLGNSMSSYARQGAQFPGCWRRWSRAQVSRQLMRRGD
jgi:hypothetical protein